MPQLKVVVQDIESYFLVYLRGKDNTYFEIGSRVFELLNLWQCHYMQTKLLLNNLL